MQTSFVCQFYKYLKKMKLKLIISCLTIIALSSCGKRDRQTGSGSISVDGSSTVYPITEAVAEEFGKHHPGIKVTVGLSGTGGGFKKFGRGETDINDASRPITEEEKTLCRSNNVSYVDLMVAYDGLAVVVNPQNDWCKEMTVAELKKLWEPAAQNKITRWNQLRPDWPDQEIHLFGPGVESGTYDYFTEVITGKSHSSRGDYTASEDDNVLVQGVSADKYALGFFGLAYYEENQGKLKLVAIDDQKSENGAGPVLPSLETVKNKTYAPLSRPLFIYVNSTAAKRDAVQQFVKYYLKNAAKLSKEVGYIPLTDEEYQAETSKFEQFLGTLK
jgi:phosphate transport system substrate-binding protein